MGQHPRGEDLGPPRICHRKGWRLEFGLEFLNIFTNLTLDSGTVGDGLIRVDGLVELLAVEVVLEKLLDLGDTGGATDQDDLVNTLKLNYLLSTITQRLTIFIDAGITE